MIKIALKNLWARRGNNIWLAIELVVVTIIAWLIIDPVAVRVYDTAQPLGYDRDRLVQLWFNTYDTLSTRYDRAASEKDIAGKHIADIRRSLEKLPQVERVTPTSQYYSPESPSTNLTSFWSTDTIQAMEGYYVPETGFFATLGASSVEGSPTIAEIDDMHLGDGDIIVTEDIAKHLFPNGNAVGQILEGRDYYKPRRIVGVIGNVRLKGFTNTRFYTFSQSNMFPVYYSGKVSENFSFLARLRPGESTEDFAEDESIRKELRKGNYYCSSIKSLDALAKEEEKNRGVTGGKILGTCLLIFFMGSLMLGVTGIFWLQTRSRSHEAGIMKSFGASPRFITATMMWEGVLLVLFTWAIGCLLYLQWGLNNGLAEKDRLIISRASCPPDWVTDFPVHFAIISAIVLAVLLIVVCIGIYIPARRISRVNPVDALRDE